MADQAAKQSKTNTYRNLFKNQTLMLLWFGKFVSVIGDHLFDLAVMWVVYDQSQSMLQSALVGVVVHLSTALTLPFSGVLADRWDRKIIMWTTNLGAALVVIGVIVTILVYGELSLIVALLAIMLLNILTVFLNPAEASVMPEIVGKKDLGTANGVFSTIGQIGQVIGESSAGILIASFGAIWALTGNAFSFLVVTGCIVIARIPKRDINHETLHKEKSTLWKDMKSGWGYTKQRPVLKGILWLTLLINIASFMGPLFPAYASQQLNGGAGVFGMLNAFAAVGGIVGGLYSGFFEKRFKSGNLLIGSLLMAGLSTICLAFTTLIPLAMTYIFIQTVCTTMASVIIITAQMNLVTEAYRGRVFSIMKTFAVLGIPTSTLIAGILGDIIGVSVLFAFAGILVTGISAYAWINPNLRQLDTKG